MSNLALFLTLLALQAAVLVESSHKSPGHGTFEFVWHDSAVAEMPDDGGDGGEIETDGNPQGLVPQEVATPPSHAESKESGKSGGHHKEEGLAEEGRGSSHHHSRSRKPRKDDYSERTGTVFIGSADPVTMPRGKARRGERQSEDGREEGQDSRMERHMWRLEHENKLLQERIERLERINTKSQGRHVIDLENSVENAVSDTTLHQRPLVTHFPDMSAMTADMEAMRENVSALTAQVDSLSDTRGDHEFELIQVRSRLTQVESLVQHVQLVMRGREAVMQQRLNQTRHELTALETKTRKMVRRLGRKLRRDADAGGFGSNCPLGFQLFMKECYLVHVTFDTWYNAQATCARHGGKMAQPETLGDAYILLILLLKEAQLDVSEFWVGARCRHGHSDQCWAWDGNSNPVPAWIKPWLPKKQGSTGLCLSGRGGEPGKEIRWVGRDCSETKLHFVCVRPKLKD